jgi:hypothetical protein
MKYKFELSVMIVVVFGLSLAGVASADSVIKTLYVDGVKVGTSTATLPLSYPYPRLTIGAEGSRYFRYNGLVGQIDEFAVYTKILTDANVTTHYSAGAGGYRTAVNADGPALYLQFEDSDSSNFSKAANNGSAADMNITYIGAVALTSSGYIGNAADLHGATDGNGDCVDVCDYSLQLSTSNVSVEFWVKTTASSDYPRLFQHNGGNTEEHSYGAMYNAGTSSIGLIGGGATGYLTSTINDGSWHHVVVTFASLVTGPYAAEVMADDPCLYLKFDSQNPVDSSSNHFYTNVTGTDANIDSNGGAYCKFKKAGGIGLSLFMDNYNYRTGDPARGRACAFAWNNWFEDPLGHLVREQPPYNGNNDNYALNTLVVVDEYGTSYIQQTDITFEMWIKSEPGLPQDRDNFGTIIQQVGQISRDPNAPELGMWVDANQVYRFRINGGAERLYTGAAVPLDGYWHQLVLTYDENEVNPGRDMGIQLYVDASLVYSTTVVDDVNFQALLGPELSQLQIGNQGDWGLPYNNWDGWVDEVAVYNGVLSAERIAAHYAAWQPKDCDEVKARGLTLWGDFNGDCKVDLFDFVLFSNEWRVCDNPSNPNCVHNW